MRNMKTGYLKWVSVSAGALAASMVLAATAAAQTSTGTIRGSILGADETTTVVAKDTSSGFTSRTTANAEGGYVLSGLRPGTYEVTVTTPQTAMTEVVTIGIGQVGELDLDLTADVAAAEEAATGEATEVEGVVVVARRLPEVRTPEIATNVSTQQIEELPQINRNFLNFAALAPGVRLSQSESEQTITAGGQRAESVNAFIDGASLKSNVIAGGIAGQDDSRGNPFPQGAIQEFRVITQNFKAEYEQASSAIITAVTRSGTNEFKGELFGTYRNQRFIRRDIFSRRRGDPRPNLFVKQYGGVLGGPIMQDRLHFLGTYEKKEEGRTATVNLGRQDPRFISQFGQFIGTVDVPFEEDLYFGKLSFQPAERHQLDLSVTWRDETDVRDIGGANSAERANLLNQKTLSSNLRYQYQGEAFLNEFAVDYRSYFYNPQAANFSEFGRSFRLFEQDANPGLPGFQIDAFGGVEILNTGGRDSRQEIYDKTLTFRNDLTFPDVEFNGYHTIKMGAKYSRQNYQVTKEFGRNPFFFFDVDGRGSGAVDVPYRVQLGNAFPSVDLTNNVIGLYIQDDWQVTDKLELNIGIRWDYESNANNVDYVTPAAVRAGLATIPFRPSFFNESDYISDGDREAFKGAFQPRLGFSYDVFDDRRTVIFGGGGRYYDRVMFNFSFDEVVKPFDFSQNVFFSTTGRPAGVASGNPDDPILFRPEYLTAAGLDSVLDTIPAKGEVFLLKNEFAPPYSDQFNLGVRQRVELFNTVFQTEFTLAWSKTHNEFTWLYLNRCGEPTRPTQGDGFGDSGGFCGPGGSNPFRGYFASDHNKEREYKALYVKIDKPYSRSSGWGLNVAYTFSEARQNGGRDFFCFDCFNIEDSPWRPSDDDERHRIVANGIVDLPLGLQLSGILTLGTGTPFDVFDGRGPFFVYRPNAGRPDKQNFVVPDAFAYRLLDLRVTKGFEVWGGSEFEVFADIINVFDFTNFSGFDGGTGSASNPNPNFGRPSTVLFPTRTFQFGARYKF